MNAYKEEREKTENFASSVCVAHEAALILQDNADGNRSYRANSCFEQLPPRCARRMRERMRKLFVQPPFPNTVGRLFPFFTFCQAKFRFNFRLICPPFFSTTLIITGLQIAQSKLDVTKALFQLRFIRFRLNQLLHVRRFLGKSFALLKSSTAQSTATPGNQHLPIWKGTVHFFLIHSG